MPDNEQPLNNTINQDSASPRDITFEPNRLNDDMTGNDDSGMTSKDGNVSNRTLYVIVGISVVCIGGSIACYLYLRRKRQ